MKSEIGKYFAVLLMFVLLPACAPTNQHINVQGIDVFATDTARINENKTNYGALADQHEHLARQMQTKTQEQKENTQAFVAFYLF